MRARWRAAFGACAVALVAAMSPVVPAHAEGYEAISGEGSSWASNAIDAMRVNVAQFGITVNYAATGSSSGRKNWLNGTVDFAASDIPFQFRPEDGSPPEKPERGAYAYIPVVAGGTSFMYNLKINGQRVTNLRLSDEVVARIFTMKITRWNDPAIVADNPGLTMPDRTITPVVRADGSGSTAQFTLWLTKRFPALWQDYCERSGRAPACGFTSVYPVISPMVSQNQDFGVASYVAKNVAEGAIGYVNYSYATEANFPVAKMLNRAGYYTEPTPKNVAVSLLKARINQDASSDDYLTQILDDVYTDTDPRNYQLSSYSYFILPTKVKGHFTEDKGRTLGAFAYYAMCQAQQQSASLGYSPMPINLVEASFEQIRKIPGVEVQDIDIKKCKNPTFSEDGTNVLAQTAEQPQECDKKGPLQCASGTGGAKQVATAVKPAASGATAAGNTSRRNVAGTNGGAGAATAGDPTIGTDGDGDAFALGGLGSDTSLPDPANTPTVLAGSSGWAGSQTLIVLVTVVLLALILLPPLLWRRVARRDLS